MRVTEEWLDTNNVDIEAFMALFGEPLEDENGYYWMVEGADEDGNGIPDALDALISDPVTTRPSKGGAYTDP